VAKEILLRYQKECGYELKITDIRTDRQLYERYCEQIPVVLIDGKKAFKYRIEEAKLRKKLERLRV
jgi:hypothetical protein